MMNAMGIYEREFYVEREFKWTGIYVEREFFDYD